MARAKGRAGAGPTRRWRPALGITALWYGGISLRAPGAADAGARRDVLGRGGRRALRRDAVLLVRIWAGRRRDGGAPGPGVMHVAGQGSIAWALGRLPTRWLRGRCWGAGGAAAWAGGVHRAGDAAQGPGPLLLAACAAQWAARTKKAPDTAPRRLERSRSLKPTPTSVDAEVRPRALGLVGDLLPSLRRAGPRLRRRTRARTRLRRPRRAG